MEPNRQTDWPQGAPRPSAWQDSGEEGRAQRPLGAGRNRPPAGSYGSKPGRGASGGYNAPGGCRPTGGYPPRQASPTGGVPLAGGYDAAGGDYGGSGRYELEHSRPQPVPNRQAWQSTGGYQAQPDPFDEPADAPELRSVRSENLNNRKGRFWEKVDGGRSGQAKPNMKPAPRADGHTIRWLMMILAVVVLVGGLVYGAVFRVRTLSVSGNRTIPEAEVIRLSGLSLGMNTFSINDAKVEERIESNRYLSFVCVDKQLPDRVVIQVKERVPAAAVKYCGILYVIDNRGMVLEESLDTSVVPENLVSVEGLRIKNCRVGEPIILTDAAQLNSYTEMMVEMKVMSALDQVQELDLTNMDNIFLVSRKGYSVRMGDSNSVHAKLRSMLMTMERLDADGYLGKGGTIDVSSPVNPTYIPQGDWLQNP